MTNQLQLDLAVQPIAGYISKRCLFIDNCDTNRHILIDSVPSYAYRINDKAQQRNVIVSLLRANLATEAELAAAFNVALRSVSRWNSKYNQYGMLGLIDKDRSGAPEKINAKLTAQIWELRAQRVKVNEIARLLNIGLGSVCRVLYAKTESQQTSLTFFEAGDGDIDSELENATVSEAADSVPCDVASYPAQTNPLDRTMDRVMARLGLLEDAAPVFVQGQRIQFAGVLLALATRESQWHLGVVKKVYRSFGASFYGIRGIFLTCIFMLLLRIKNCEQIREYNPATLGMLLGLDRAPEVKTLRRKLRLLYAREQSLECMDQMRAVRSNSNEPQLLATLYIDGHVKAYYGKYPIGSTHSGRLHRVVRGCTDYWVNAHGGKPFCVISTDFNDAMTSVLVEIVKNLKEEYRTHGIDGAGMTIVFDRGGYSGKIFEQLLSMGVKIITYNRGPIDPVDKTLFDGKKMMINDRKYPASPIERTMKIDVYETMPGDGTRKSAAKKTGRVVELREILILRYDQGITSVLTNIKDTERPAAAVASELFGRWPQENYLKYMMEEFALDHLHAYGAEDIDGAIEHPNPEYTKIKKELSNLTVKVEKNVGRQTLKQLQRSPGMFEKLQKKLAKIKIQGFSTIKECMDKIAALRALLSTIKERITVSGYKRLASESRTFHQFLKMSAYQIETELVEILRQHYPDLNGDARTIIASMLKSSATLMVENGNLIVTLDPQSSPQRTGLLKNVCDQLNQRAAIYPGSNLTLLFRTQMVDT
jgi:transposase